MQNKFSRDFVEQKDKEKEARARRISELLPPRVTIPEIGGEKYGCEYPNTEWLVIKVFIFAAVLSGTIFIVSKIIY